MDADTRDISFGKLCYRLFQTRDIHKVIAQLEKEYQAINFKIKIPLSNKHIFIIFRQKTPTQLVGWGMNGAGFEHIVLQPLMRLLHNCQHSSFCSKSFLWKGIDPN